MLLLAVDGSGRSTVDHEWSIALYIQSRFCKRSGTPCVRLTPHWLDHVMDSRRPRPGEQERTADDKFICCHPTYVGRNILLCGRKQSTFPFQCMIGPDWPCMLVTYCLIVVPSIFFLIFIAARIHLLALLLGLASFLATLIFFSMTACSDPGIVYKRAAADESLNAVEDATAIPCARCELTRPPGASHCYDCEVCVMELDHHCPWTGKCIGKRNIRFFYLFLTTLTIHILYVGILTGMHAITSAFKIEPPN